MRYGLTNREAAGLLNALTAERNSWALKKLWFQDNKARFAQSLNRSFEEYYDMAEKAKRKIGQGTKVDSEFTWKGFVDVKLNDTHKANYAAWDIEDNDVWDGIATYCEAGVKIAISYNKQNASFNCAGTGQTAAGANSGYCVVAHAKSPYEAARVWLYKVSAILPNVWNEYDSGNEDDIG
jgi:hypothetical protein